MTICTGVILAGGRATRYGGLPKGLEKVGGQRILDRVAATLREATDELLLVANADDADSWIPDVRRRRDVIADAGSLGGIHAALAHAGTAVIVVAWDMPFVPPPLLRRLRQIGATHDAVVPESESKRGAEPLCAFYSQACLAPIERRLEAGDRRVVSFFEDVHVARVSFDEVQQFGDPAIMFMNVNSPDELALANAYDASDSHGRWAQA
ncbi:MAG TPA: molybdenum cofactor guanylyltransferase [Gemmatimonadaceae bacterium]|nr:molybdenum cofactor guanylyltransferase [Gemmatimonadaceae bacterium]